MAIVSRIYLEAFDHAIAHLPHRSGCGNGNFVQTIGTVQNQACLLPSLLRASANGWHRSGVKTPRTWRSTKSRVGQGAQDIEQGAHPQILARTTACFMAPWWAGANIKPIPTCSIDEAIPSGDSPGRRPGLENIRGATGTGNRAITVLCDPGGGGHHEGCRSRDIEQVGATRRCPRGQ